MKRNLTPEEILFEKEGRGRFNLAKSITFYTNPDSATNLPVPGHDDSPVLPRVKLVPRLQRDANGIEVRVFVPYKKRRG